MPRVVLVHPEIPPNTGSVARTCAATKTELHLVEPLGFELSDRHLKRAGLDYWPYVSLRCHPSWSTFDTFCQVQGGRRIAFSTKGSTPYLNMRYRTDDWLLFGCESAGLPPEIRDACTECVYIPITEPYVRSLNLSVSVAIGLFEARRQLNLGE